MPYPPRASTGEYSLVLVRAKAAEDVDEDRSRDPRVIPSDEQLVAFVPASDYQQFIAEARSILVVFAVRKP